MIRIERSQDVYADGAPRNRCIECNEDLGPQNMRQLCHKTHCPNSFLKDFHAEPALAKEAVRDIALVADGVDWSTVFDMSDDSLECSESFDEPEVELPDYRTFERFATTVRTSPFVPKDQKETKFLETLYSCVRGSDAVFIAMIVYIDRFQIPLCLLTLGIISAKMWEDDHCSNLDFAREFERNIDVVNRSEREFLSEIGFNLFVSAAAFAKIKC